MNTPARARARVRRLPRALLALCLATLAPAAAGQAFTGLPGHFEVLTLPGTFNVPVGLCFADDGTLFLLEKPGVVRVLSDAGSQQPLPFLDLSAEVNNDWDRGLLGIALHPGFVPDGGATSWVYLLYTVSPVPPADNGFNQNNKYSFSRLTRWRAVTNGASIVADLASRQVLLGNQLPDGSVPDAIASLHNSHSNGSLRFADDGTLLLATGDGAHYDFQDNGGADNPGFDDFVHPQTLLKGPTPKIQDEGAFRSLDPRSLAGKVLRIDPATGLGLPSNPLWNGDGASNASRVWALGLRNPFRMDLAPGTGARDPALGQPNVVLLGDVGWNIWEELNVARFGGENFGWPCYEGIPAQNGYQAYTTGNPNKVTCQTPLVGTLTPPALAWHHSNVAAYKPAGVHKDEAGNVLGGFRGNCAIGGPIYSGGAYPGIYVGRMFVADYGQQWIKTVEFDGAWNVTAVKDFASATGPLVAIERHPVTGDLYWCNVATGRVQRLNYGANLTPVAIASASPESGAAPLNVQFTGSTSSDPDGDPLSYAWDFDDGSPPSTLANPLHVYASNGLYDVTLRVTDPLGAFGETTVQVAVGNVPPTVSIVSPQPGALFAPPTALSLLGSGSDPEGQPLQYDWNIDLYHATHVHPGTFQASGASASFPIDVSPEDLELLYYRVQLTVTDVGGLSKSAAVFVYPQANHRDIAGTALPIAKMHELSPPEPTGGGNHDIEVIRDALLPAVGSALSAQQYDTFHGGAQGNDDWIGYALPAPPGEEFRFTRVEFQEGKHFVDGGWWEDLRVEVRQGGTWSTVPGVTITPAYPFALAGQAFFDGVNYQSYVLRFDPVAGDALRLRGNPGGSANFTSVGELRVFGIEGLTPDGYADITASGTIIAKLFSMVPPTPQGGGNQDPQTLRNGTQPPVGSTSFHAQFDTFHGGAQAGEDWIGYDFGAPTTIARLRFQEGRNNTDGGAFTNVAVQVQTTAGGPWTNLSGVSVSPPYTGLNGVHYETFVFDFAPISARAIRLRGAPAGSNQFISVGELRAYAPAPAGCGWQAFGAPGGSNTLQLHGEGSPLLGFPIEIHGTGASGPASGTLGVALAAAALPFKNGTLHLDPGTLLLFGASWDGGGELHLPAVLPNDAGLAGLSIWLQAFAFGQPQPWPVRLSNGLKLTFCGS